MIYELDLSFSLPLTHHHIWSHCLIVWGLWLQLQCNPIKSCYFSLKNAVTQNSKIWRFYCLLPYSNQLVIWPPKCLSYYTSHWSLIDMTKLLWWYWKLPWIILYAPHWHITIQCQCVHLPDVCLSGIKQFGSSLILWQHFFVRLVFANWITQVI